MQMDSQFASIRYHLSESAHHYGSNVHLLSNPLLLTQLARLCAEDTHQPMINELVMSIYGNLLQIVINAEFERADATIPTRMRQYHAEGVYQGPVVDPNHPVVCVNLARAGTLPSHTCYNALNYFMKPTLVRQDHIGIARTVDVSERVTGSLVSGHKIGGSVKGATILFPDPMGATGSTIIEAAGIYKKLGGAHKMIALHCIVTPEYLKAVTQAHPNLVIYAIRLDRGLSPKDVLSTVPGTHWDRERGLNDKHYIVPGGGGFGEVFNNAYV